MRDGNNETTLNYTKQRCTHLTTRWGMETRKQH